MAEGFEPFHVPQQSRRDKLRVSNPPPPPGCVDYQSCAPLYDFPSDFLPCSANVHHAPVKAESLLPMMPFFGGAAAGNMPFADPHMSVQLNPSAAAPYGYPSPAAAAAQSLSLSLSSHHQKYDFFSGGAELPPSKSAVPLGPFTGYASVLKGSRFLGPAHQLLEELCDMGRVMYADRTGPDPDLLDPPPILHDLGDDCAEQSRKKSRLLSMLDEVYKRYKQYYQQMQAAVAAFESVAGLSSAAPFANSALNSMSKHFTCLKNAITDQLQFTSTSKLNRDRSSFSGAGPPGFVDQPVWRPQRGLPEHAVAVLRSWLFEHFLHPYPTDTDKLMLAKQTGLSRNQVSNWFINARVRLWKPMVEEIHTLETRQTQKVNEQQPPTFECENNNNASTSSIQRGRSEYPSKRTRESPRENRGYMMKSPYEHLIPSIGTSNVGGGNGGVSLTLGLHQNGMGLTSDSYPINAARRFGLDPDDRDEYVVSGFDSQNRQFGRDQHHHHHHHIMEGQIMHDFVG